MKKSFFLMMALLVCGSLSALDITCDFGKELPKAFSTECPTAEAGGEHFLNCERYVAGMLNFEGDEAAAVFEMELMASGEPAAKLGVKVYRKDEKGKLVCISTPAWMKSVQTDSFGKWNHSFPAGTFKANEKYVIYVYRSNQKGQLKIRRMSLRPAGAAAATPAAPKPQAVSSATKKAAAKAPAQSTAAEGGADLEILCEFGKEIPKAFSTACPIAEENGEHFLNCERYVAGILSFEGVDGAEAALEMELMAAGQPPARLGVIVFRKDEKGKLVRLSTPAWLQVLPEDSFVKKSFSFPAGTFKSGEKYQIYIYRANGKGQLKMRRLHFQAKKKLVKA